MLQDDRRVDIRIRLYMIPFFFFLIIIFCDNASSTVYINPKRAFSDFHTTVRSLLWQCRFLSPLRTEDNCHSCID